MESIKSFIFTYDGMVYLKKEKDGSVNVFSTEKEIECIKGLLESQSWNKPRLDVDMNNDVSLVKSIMQFKTEDGMTCLVIPLDYDTRKELYYVTDLELSIAKIYLYDLKNAIEQNKDLVLGMYEQLRDNISYQFRLGDRLVYSLI